MSLGVVLFIVALLVVIMVHEAGHFLVAKALGFKATKFFIGFGPTLWSFTKGETEYGIKAIPAGGFVKIVGMNPYEDVPAEDEPRSYPNKPRWQRALMIAAGPATHWPLAFVTLFVTALIFGLPTLSPVISQVQPDSPAAQADVQEGDRIVAVNGRPVDSWDETREEILANAGEQTTFTIVRDDEELSVTTTLHRALFDAEGLLIDEAGPGEALQERKPGYTEGGYLGVAPTPVVTTPSFTEAIADSGSTVALFTKESASGLLQPFSQVVNGELWDALRGQGPRGIEEGPVGIVGAGRLAGETVENGSYFTFANFMVGLTIFVGLINLLPLPPLDGGHLLVILYESITRRKVDIRKLIPIAAAVISFFVLLFVAVLYLDLVRPLKIPL